MLTKCLSDRKPTCRLSNIVRTLYFFLLSVVPVLTRLCNITSYHAPDDMCLWVTRLRSQMIYLPAVDECRKLGGRIVALNTKEKHFIALKMLQELGQHSWIGLDDIVKDGTYVWTSTKEVLTVTDPWITMNPPMSTGLDCFKMSYNGSYMSKSCQGFEGNIMCEAAATGCADLSAKCISSKCGTATPQLEMTFCRKACSLCKFDICDTNNDCEYDCMASGKNTRVCLCPPLFTPINETHCYHNVCDVNNGDCQGSCDSISSGKGECGCGTGLKLVNSTDCVNGSACDTGNGGCSQICKPFNGRPICSCRDGFEFVNNTTCKPKPTPKTNSKNVVSGQSSSIIPYVIGGTIIAAAAGGVFYFVKMKQVSQQGQVNGAGEGEATGPGTEEVSKEDEQISDVEENKENESHAPDEAGGKDVAEDVAENVVEDDANV